MILVDVLIPLDFLEKLLKNVCIDTDRVGRKETAAWTANSRDLPILDESSFPGPCMCKIGPHDLPAQSKLACDGIDVSLVHTHLTRISYSSSRL